MEDKIISALELYKKLHTKAIEIENIFGGGFEFLGNELDGLCDLIADLAEIPEDNTIEYIEKFGEKGMQHENYYCRDWVLNILSDFTDEIISAKKVAKILINKKYDN